MAFILNYIYTLILNLFNINKSKIGECIKDLLDKDLSNKNEKLKKWFFFFLSFFNFSSFFNFLLQWLFMSCFLVITYVIFYINYLYFLLDYGIVFYPQNFIPIYYDLLVQERLSILIINFIYLFIIFIVFFIKNTFLLFILSPFIIYYTILCNDLVSVGNVEILGYNLIISQFPNYVLIGTINSVINLHYSKLIQYGGIIKKKLINEDNLINYILCKKYKLKKKLDIVCYIEKWLLESSQYKTKYNYSLCLNIFNVGKYCITYIISKWN